MLCPMQEKENADVLLRYFDSKLDPASRAAFERHMAVCPACAGTFAAQAAVWAALDEWNDVPVSSNFDGRLYARIDAQKKDSWIVRAWRTVFAAGAPIDWKPVAPLALACLTLIAVVLVRTLDTAVQSPAGTGVVTVSHTDKEIETVERTLEDLEMLSLLAPSETSELKKL